MASRDGGPRSRSGDGGRHREVRASIPLPLPRIPASPDGDGDRAPRTGTFFVRSEYRRRISREAEEPVGRLIDETWNVEPDGKMAERGAEIIRPSDTDDVALLCGSTTILLTLCVLET